MTKPTIASREPLLMDDFCGFQLFNFEGKTRWISIHKKGNYQYLSNCHRNITTFDKDANSYTCNKCKTKCNLYLIDDGIYQLLPTVDEKIEELN